ncbi:RDD family protein [Flavobacterium akiainvivens]|uniref:RDD family protein n=1 Tax=Flavobacterium akiainvivens TaxID=1202724 RepID=UPI0008F07804|nr:RDD family protein [Flavobacterium akiainvivens]SFQ74695.1 Uncharacterized membrane protein YckC, RDD family [Flavobacterium akiainvivens]
MNNTEFEIDHEVFAGKSTRIANMVIDTIVCTILLMLVYLAILLLYKFAGMEDLMLWYIDMGSFTKLAIAAGVTFFYYLVFETLTGSTIGKYATGTRVVDAYGQKPSVKAVLIRTLIRLMPFEVFTFVGESAVGLHDSASKTYVVSLHKLNLAHRMKAAYTEMGITQNPFLSDK